MPSAVAIGLAVRPLLRARDLALLVGRPQFHRATSAIWRAERAHPPHKPSFEAIRSGIGPESLTWGETPVSTAHAALRRAGCDERSSLLDLGAGRGSVLIAARVLGARARGIEIDPDRVAPVKDALASVDAQLEVGDARTASLDGATHLWLAWTTWSSALRKQIAERIPSGVKVISVTWAPQGLNVVDERRALFSWGFADVVISERAP